MKKSTGVALAVTAIAVAVGVVEGVRRFIVEMNELEYGFDMCDDPDCNESGCGAVKPQTSSTPEATAAPEKVAPIRPSRRKKNDDDAVLGEGFLVEL